MWRVITRYSRSATDLSGISEDSDAKRESWVGFLGGSQQPSGTRLSCGGLQQIDCVERALGRLFVFEVSEDVASRTEVISIARDHRLAFFGGIARLAVAIVGEIGRN